MAYVSLNRKKTAAEIEALTAAVDGKIYFGKDGGIYLGLSSGSAQKQADKTPIVSEFQSVADDSHVPSEKLVKDTMVGKSDLYNSGSTVIKSEHLPAYVDEVVEGYYVDNTHFYLDSAHTQLVTPTTSKIYADLTNLPAVTSYRWTGSIYFNTGSNSADIVVYNSEASTHPEGTVGAELKSLSDGKADNLTVVDKTSSVVNGVLSLSNIEAGKIYTVDSSTAVSSLELLSFVDWSGAGEYMFELTTASSGFTLSEGTGYESQWCNDPEDISGGTRLVISIQRKLGVWGEFEY